MRYWDSSAILPLLVQESTTSAMDALVREDPAMITWWGTSVECVSALARLEREGSLSVAQMRAALTRLEQMRTEWIEVPPLDDVRLHAARLLRSHALRAADALQVAAAVVAADNRPSDLVFITLDRRQGEAADREGFLLRGPGLG